MNTSTFPWRVVNDGECWQVWTARNETPGSRNNYVIADGIQSREEALQLAAAPVLFAAAKTLAALEIDDCHHCHGNGFEPHNKKEACHICGGCGELTSPVWPDDVRLARAAIARAQSSPASPAQPPAVQYSQHKGGAGDSN